MLTGSAFGEWRIGQVRAAADTAGGASGSAYRSDGKPASSTNAHAGPGAWASEERGALEKNAVLWKTKEWLLGGWSWLLRCV